MSHLHLKIPEDDTVAHNAAAMSKRLEKDIYLPVDVIGRSAGQPSVNKLVAAQDSIEEGRYGFNTYRDGELADYTGHEGCRVIIEQGRPT